MTMCNEIKKYIYIFLSKRNAFDDNNDCIIRALKSHVCDTEQSLTVPYTLQFALKENRNEIETSIFLRILCGCGNNNSRKLQRNGMNIRGKPTNSYFFIRKTKTRLNIWNGRKYYFESRKENHVDSFPVEFQYFGRYFFFQERVLFSNL